MPRPASQAAPQYLIFEGNVESIDKEFSFLKTVLGPNHRTSPHQYGYGIGEIPLLTRSTPWLKAMVDHAFDVAEREDIPVFFHLDPLYGFFADTEKSASDAPSEKYWKDPKMREWIAFPVEGKLPQNIPRPWFNWGSWVSPAPALPAFASPTFLNLACSQIREGIARPIAIRLRKLRKSGREKLFAGINIGWETHFLNTLGVDPKTLPEAVWPTEQRGVRMKVWEAGAQTGYASLYWRGWNSRRVAKEAERLRVPSQTVVQHQLFTYVHDYMQSLAHVCVEGGLDRHRIFTHEVAIGSAHPEHTGPDVPPTWVAVNPYSTPGFTMDSRGAAVYNLSTLMAEILKADPSQHSFAAIESYLKNYPDEKSFTDSINETFDHGGTVKVLFGVFGQGTPFALDPQPRNATLAVLRWLAKGE